MALSREWTEWHLTPRGWERGTEKTDFDWTDRPRPSDAVMSVTYKEEQSSAFSTMDKSKTVTWTADEALIEPLRKQFGEPPSRL